MMSSSFSRGIERRAFGSSDQLHEVRTPSIATSEHRWLVDARHTHQRCSTSTVIEAGANDSGDRIVHKVADIDRERLSRTLRDLADFIEMAQEVTSRTRAVYDADITLRLAGEAIVTRVGQAVSRLPENFKQVNPQVPWRSIKGARNLTSQYYHRIDHHIIWLTLERELPEIGRRLGL